MIYIFFSFLNHFIYRAKLILIFHFLSHNRDKLHGLEYPLGERLIVRVSGLESNESKSMKELIYKYLKYLKMCY